MSLLCGAAALSRSASPRTGGGLPSRGGKRRKDGPNRTRCAHLTWAPLIEYMERKDGERRMLEKMMARAGWSASENGSRVMSQGRSSGSAGSFNSQRPASSPSPWKPAITGMRPPPGWRSGSQLSTTGSRGGALRSSPSAPAIGPQGVPPKSRAHFGDGTGTADTAASRATERAERGRAEGSLAAECKEDLLQASAVPAEVVDADAAEVERRVSSIACSILSTLGKCSETPAYYYDDEPLTDISAVFHRFAQEGVLAVGGVHFQRALTALGHPYPNFKLVKAIVIELVHGRESLDEEDFEIVAAAYLQHSLVRLKDAFEFFNGKAAALPALLHRVGLSPMPGSAEEVVYEVGEDVTCEEFLRVHRELTNRAGLTHQEHERLRSFFDSHEEKRMISEIDVLEGFGFSEHMIELVGGSIFYKRIAREAVARSLTGQVVIDPSAWGCGFGKSKQDPEAVDSELEIKEGVKYVPRKECSVGLPAFLAAARALHYILNIKITQTYELLKMPTDGTISVYQQQSILEELGVISALIEDVASFARIVASQTEGRSPGGKRPWTTGGLVCPFKRATMIDEQLREANEAAAKSRPSSQGGSRSQGDPTGRGRSGTGYRTGRLARSTTALEASGQPAFVEQGAHKLLTTTTVPDMSLSFLDEAAENQAAEKPELTYTQMYQMVLQYCLSEGFTERESSDLVAAFRRFDEDESGTISAGELGPVIRWLGYQPSHFRLYDFAEEIGVTLVSEYDIAEFRAIVAKYKRRMLSGVMGKFLDEKTGKADKCILTTQLIEVIQLMGYELGASEVQQLMQNAKDQGITRLSFRDFKMFEARHRRQVMATMDKNGGFTDTDLTKHSTDFKDNETKGSLSQKAIRGILNGIFPDKSLTKGWHEKIAKIVHDADADGNGLFDFKEYLVLMKDITIELDKEMLMNGLKRKEELGYSSAEMKQLRDLYRACDADMSGDVDIDELTSIVENLVKIDKAASRELKAMVEEIDDGDNLLDFWEFLNVMKMLQDRNWHNINGVA